MGLYDPSPDFIPPADLPPNYSGYTTDPYLFYRPIFARSLPVQMFISGITITLVCILLIQLMFTAPYHARLARLNFFLQLSAALVLLASQIAGLTLLLNATQRQSQNWPFMLEYIAVDLPPLNFPRSTEGWSLAGLIAWLFMNALVSALTQVCRPPSDVLHFPIHLLPFIDHAHTVPFPHVSFSSRSAAHIHPTRSPRNHSCRYAACAAPPQ